MNKHDIVHVELSAKDPKSAGKFYSELFGWKTEYDEKLDYVSWGEEGGVGGGFPKVGENTAAGSVIVYISTDDIDASLKKAESLGAKTVTPKMEIPNIGHFAIFSDPTGNMIGLYTAFPKS